MRVHAIAGELEQAEHVRGRRAAAVDDEVRLLGRNLGAADTLAAHARFLEQALGGIAGRVLEAWSRRSQRERLRGLLLLEALADVALDLRERPAREPEPAADDDGAG